MVCLLRAFAFASLAAVAHGLLTKTDKVYLQLPTDEGGFLESDPAIASSDSHTYSVQLNYDSSASDCNGTVVSVIGHSHPYCSPLDVRDDTCYLDDSLNASSSVLSEVPYSHYQYDCVEDMKEFADGVFGDQVYLRLDYYTSAYCDYWSTKIYIADDECHSIITIPYPFAAQPAASYRATVNANATISLVHYSTSDCKWLATAPYLATEEDFSITDCHNLVKMYTNLDVYGNGKGISVSSAIGGDGLSTGAIAGITVGCFAFVVIVCFFLRRRKLRSQKTQAEEWVEHPKTPEHGTIA